MCTCTWQDELAEDDESVDSRGIAGWEVDRSARVYLDLQRLCVTNTQAEEIKRLTSDLMEYGKKPLTIQLTSSSRVKADLLGERVLAMQVLRQWRGKISHLHTISKIFRPLLMQEQTINFLFYGNSSLTSQIVGISDLLQALSALFKSNGLYTCISFNWCFLSAVSPASSSKSRVVEALCILLCQKFLQPCREVNAATGRPSSLPDGSVYSQSTTVPGQDCWTARHCWRGQKWGTRRILQRIHPKTHMF